MLNMPLQQTVWHIERLPELFWLAFVSRRIGYSATLELAYRMALDIESTVHRVRGNDMAFRAYLPSEHNSCSDREKEQIFADHRNSDWLGELQLHLLDMLGIWAELPFRYLLPTRMSDSKNPKIASEVKAIIGDCSDRHDKLALIVQAMLFSLECRTEKLFFAPGLDIPDLNAVFDYPNTDESKHAAGFIVASCGGIVLHRGAPQEELDFTWQRSFWNACFRLEPSKHE